MRIETTVMIIRAATANMESRCVFQPALVPATEIRGADQLADVALQACEPLVCDLDERMKSRTGLVIGTALGCLETDRDFDRSRREAGGRYASPAAFSRTLPSTVAAELSLKLSLQGPSVVLCNGVNSAALALRRAVSWMTHFDLPYCIAGGMEWAGPGVGQTESCAAALLLLQRHSDETEGRFCGLMER